MIVSWEKMRAYLRKDDNTHSLLCRIIEIACILKILEFLLMKCHA